MQSYGNTLLFSEYYIIQVVNPIINIYVTVNVYGTNAQLSIIRYWRCIVDKNIYIALSDCRIIISFFYSKNSHSTVVLWCILIKHYSKYLSYNLLNTK